eukprot:g1173.t1
MAKMRVVVTVALTAVLFVGWCVPTTAAKEKPPQLDIQAVPSASRAAYTAALRRAYGDAAPSTAKAKKARARNLKEALDLFDGHAPVHHSLGVIYGQLAAGDGKRGSGYMRKARHHLRLAVEKLSAAEDGEFRAIYAANYAQAVYGMDPGPDMSHVKTALRLCTPEGEDTWPLPGPCSRIADQLQLKSLDVIDADEL